MRGRGDLLLELRLLLRPRALVAGVGGLAGLAGLVGAYLPWYGVSMRVTYAPWTPEGAPAPQPVSHSVTHSSLAGWEAHPWGWLAPALALIALAVGLLAALDRPPPRHDNLQIGIGLGLAVLAGVSALVLPPVDRFGGRRLQQLADLADRLPTDVELTFGVGPAWGLWVTLGAAVLLVTAGVVSRRL